MDLLKTMSALSILSAVSADLKLFQRPGPIRSEKIFNTCFFWNTDNNPRFLSLAHKSLNFSKTLEGLVKNSQKSEFDLRTFDPEGLIFYGDIKENWFILALRNGSPEIQISNQYCHMMVTSSETINNGKWRRIIVKSEKNNIKLLLDGRPILKITMLPNIGLEGTTKRMRIALGHAFINTSSFIVPLKDRLDGCITNWNWMQQNTTWLEKKLASNPNMQCPTNITPGTFFQGAGMAVFESSGFHNNSDSQVDWTLRFEATIRPVKHSGAVLAILSQAYKPLLRLDFVEWTRQEQFRLRFGGDPVLQLQGPNRLCSGQRLTLAISREEATLRVGDQQETWPLAKDTFTPLIEAWFKKEAKIFLGGLPVLTILGFDWFNFAGCMQDMRLQGMAVDLNQAMFVHDSISTHSCPAPEN
ncbi:sex hormone-binding globulin [Narcine bancroftii]|uniref:sex hormone-binding globulin n=1 Tax=Narcine bancroftii TaxID=1343680 RepID=UPI00383126A3